MTGRGSPALAVALLAIGGGVLFLASAEWLRVLSAVLMLAGIAAGVFAIATPEFVAGDRDDDSER